MFSLRPFLLVAAALFVATPLAALAQSAPNDAQIAGIVVAAIWASTSTPASWPRRPAATPT